MMSGSPRYCLYTKHLKLRGEEQKREGETLSLIHIQGVRHVERFLGQAQEGLGGLSCESQVTTGSSQRRITVLARLIK
jgi:hypothetical protein